MGKDTEWKTIPDIKEIADNREESMNRAVASATGQIPAKLDKSNADAWVNSKKKYLNNGYE